MSTIIVGVLLIGIIALIIYNLVRKQKQCDCANGCGHCKGCH